MLTVNRWSCLMSVVLQFRTIRNSTVQINNRWLLLKPELLRLLVNALQLNELNALRNAFYPEYKYLDIFCYQFFGISESTAFLLHQVLSHNWLLGQAKTSKFEIKDSVQYDTIISSFHKLLEIFQKFNVISQKVALKIAQKKSRTAFCNESWSKVAQKRLFFCCSLPLFGLMLKYANFTKKSKISKHFCAILRRNQDCKITLSSIKPQKSISKVLILIF